MKRLSALVLALLLTAAGALAQPGGHTGALAAGDRQLPGGEFYDTYTLDARAGQTIEADMGSEDFDPYLVVVAPSGATAENDDHEGSAAHARLAMEATETGQYRVLATSYAPEATGRYVLALRVGGEARPAGDGWAEPAPASMAGGRPAGLFFMTRYWIATQYLEKLVWYFAPDGQVYSGLGRGLSAGDLAAHEGGKGTYGVAGSTLTVEWSDGSVTEGEMEGVSASGFNWDAGLFAPIEPFAPGRSIAGTYSGGSSMTFSGATTITSTALDLRADGTYSRDGVASIYGEGYDAGGANAGGGTWRADGYSLVLRDAGGGEERLFAFPFDDDETPAYPDMLFTRQ